MKLKTYTGEEAMNFDFRKCKTKEDVEEVFRRNKSIIPDLKQALQEEKKK